MSQDKRTARAAAAAQVAAEARRRERRSNALKIGAVVVAMAAIIAICVVVGLHKGNTGKVDAAVAGRSDSASYGLAIGDANAPHHVVIYEDFLCPFCDQLELASRDQLAALAQQGKVYVDYRPFRLLQPDYSEQALNAFAVVLKTSGPQVAKKFHDLLYENQPSEQGPFPGVASLVALAVKAGADESKVKAGIEDTTSQQTWVDGATNAAEGAGVQGTPTILLDGKVFQEGSTVPQMAQNLIKAVS